MHDHPEWGFGANVDDVVPEGLRWAAHVWCADREHKAEIVQPRRGREQPLSVEQNGQMGSAPAGKRPREEQRPEKPISRDSATTS
jgi:hypothetical protein